MTSRPLVFLVVIVLIIAGLAGYGYLTRSQRHFDNPIIEKDSSSDLETGKDVILGTLETTSTTKLSNLSIGMLDTSSWQIYVNKTYEYSIEYPQDAIPNVFGDILTVSFPKSQYFRWPLEDDAKVTVTVGSSCPAVIGTGSDPGPIVSQLEQNGLKFKKSIGSEIVGGNRFLEIAYDTISRGNCYHISFFVRGTNGSSVYVDSKSLIEKYDAEHVEDLNTVINIVHNMLKTFRILAPAL